MNGADYTDCNELAAPDMAGVEQVLLRACGVSLGSDLRETLRQGLFAAAEATGIAPCELVQRLLSEEPASVAALIDHSVVGETYFYRHPEQFSALGRQLAEAEGSLSIWSAGCGSGEEPYSLAMTLLEAGRGPGRDHIIATDISERALGLAREGLYGNSRLRQLDPELAARYFDGAPSARLAGPAREMVEFRRHNLVTDPPPGRDFDVVVCRNVLVYFAPDTAAEVLRALLDSLRPGGLLVLGPVELPLAAPLWVEWIESSGATLLRKPREFSR